jgi:sirohydrochlorin ferrochelatase
MNLILLSHGSVLCGAEQNLLQVAERLQRRLGGTVEAAFLNHSEPRFLDAFARSVASGADEIVILPFFLIAGKFVTDDLPRLIAEAVGQHPQVNVRVASPIGFHEALAEAVLHCAARATPPSKWRDATAQTRSFCRDSKLCPLHRTSQCPAGAVVEAR